MAPQKGPSHTAQEDTAPTTSAEVDADRTGTAEADTDRTGTAEVDTDGTGTAEVDADGTGTAEVDAGTHALEIDRAELLGLRLASQWIAPTAAAGTGVADVVRHLLAMQAQDFGQGLWALGVRAPGTTREQVLAELARGSVVRSWPMRGTLHFVAPDDLRWMLQLTASRTLASAATRQRQLDLDQDTLDRSADLARTELAGGGAATRAEFLAVLEDAGITTTGQRGYHIIWYLAQIGLICWGPPRRTGQAMVLLDEWAPPNEEVDNTEALRRFALGYFRGHGPATIKDFAWWSKLTMADARQGLAAARDELGAVHCGGGEYWMSASRPAASKAPAKSGVHLLPGFDEFLLGYQDRSHALPFEHANRIVPGGNGIFYPVMVSHGRIIGTWHRARNTTAVDLSAEPFERLTAEEAAGFARAAADYAGFVGLQLNHSG
ncbi:winged helix DNA-binding domain-containing protein [Parafrigoribacterium mesophilum]|uniref:winged helix DNA-binding domain-containing protein n=1 Tax=Parafrigoribacterium mesophilum TaxID=433646 RepID=UPI0031FD6718